MYFHVRISPSRNLKPQKKAVEEDNEESAILSLAPFCANPRLQFENILLGETAVRKLLIQNPTASDIQLYLTRLPPVERGVVVSLGNGCVKAHSELTVDIIWNARKEGSWRDVITLEDGGRIKKDVPIVFKCMLPKKSKARPTAKLAKKPAFPKKPTKLLNVTNVPQIIVTPPKLRTKGKENNYISNSTFESDFQFVPANTELFKPTSFIDNGRETYIVPKPKVVQLESVETFDDSLEMEKSPTHLAKEPVKPLHDKNDFGRMLASQLDSQSFYLTPVRCKSPLEGSFNPFVCSSEEKSKTPAAWDLNSGILNCSQETYVKGNLSMETYVKGNISTETYTKGNISTETYTKGNMSTETYIKTIDETVFKNESEWEKYQRSPLFSDYSRSNFIESNLLSIGRQNQNFGFKRKSNSTITISPPKRINYDSDTISKNKKSARKTNTRSIHRYQKQESAENQQHANTSDINLFILTDHFYNSELFSDADWVEKQEICFKNWLNALLTPPAELNSEAEAQTPLNVAKLWQECKKKEICAAPSKEVVSSQYHTNKRLDALRNAAAVLYRSPQIASVLFKVVTAIQQGKLAIREDRDVHLDLGLQAEVMSLFLSYNPLWLRIGLETVYKTVIPMNSNSDIMSLSQFLFRNFFKSQKLLSKYKITQSRKYAADIKKIILIKFFELVYFLDEAKRSKLIKHDPCLFTKNAEHKDNRTILLKFSSLVLSSVGDVTRYLKCMGYVVSYQQYPIHEYDFAVRSLGVDLRDGIILTKVAEIILIKEGLLNEMRVPAISRLQKIHNVRVAFEAFQNDGFLFTDDITPKDIADGHREKTFSFLWQIINKFEVPRLTKAAVVLQKWWRGLGVTLRRRKLNREWKLRNDSAAKIQKWYRHVVFTRKVRLFIGLVKEVMLRKKVDKAATVIQSNFKMYLERRKFVEIKKSVLFIQKRFRITRRNRAATVIQKNWKRFINRRRYLRLKSTVVFVEKRYASKKLTIETRNNFCHFRAMVIFIQRRFRDKLTSIKHRKEFEKLKKSTIKIQSYFRMYIYRNEYLNLKATVLRIQRLYRAKKKMEVDYRYYLTLKRSVVFIQHKFRASKLMKVERTNYLRLKSAALKIQNYYHAQRLMNIERRRYVEIKKAVIFVQRKFRANKVMKKAIEELKTLKCHTILIQRRFKAKLLMKAERQRFLELKTAVTIIQNRYRAILLTRNKRREFLELRSTCFIIQRKFKAKKLARIERTHYLHLKECVLKIQERFRSRQFGKIERSNYVTLRESVILIQRRFRANLQAKKQRQIYLKLKEKCIFLQTRFRANITAKEARKAYCELKACSIFIQRLFRANKEMQSQKESYQKLKRVTINLQQRFRARKLMHQERNYYFLLKKSTIAIQRRFKANKLMKEQRSCYLILKNACVTVQTKYRAIISARIQRNSYIRLKDAVIKIQRYYRRYKLMKTQRIVYLQQTQAIKTLIPHIKGFLVRNKCRPLLTPENILRRKIIRRENAAATRIQALWRGYRVRRAQSGSLVDIRQRCILANNAAQPHLTLAYRVTVELQKLNDALKLANVIESFQFMDNATRVCSGTCELLGDILSEISYSVLTAISRSLMDLDVAVAAVGILINLCRYPPTFEKPWRPQYLDDMFLLMLHWCDKESLLFPYVCTLFWLLAHKPSYRLEMTRLPKIEHRLEKIETLVGRKVKMVKKSGSNRVSSVFIAKDELLLPFKEPDWGLELKGKPRTFLNSPHALKCLTNILLK